MKHLTVLSRALCVLLFALFVTGCGTSDLSLPFLATPTLVPTTTPYPTYTPLPTLTPYATLTPYPTYTPVPPTPKPTMPLAGQWVTGHFWAIKLVSARAAATLDGKRPSQDVFIVVEVDWKTNDTRQRHTIEGMDFELVDAAGKQYTLAGMIYRLGNTTEPQGPGETYNDNKYRSTEAWGNAGDTYKLVFDVPSLAKELKLWFQDSPLIDLGLKPPYTGGV